MLERHLIKRNKIICPRCDGHKGIMGKSATGHPATLICPRCEGVGELWEDDLTDAERVIPTKKFFERDDNF